MGMSDRFWKRTYGELYGTLLHEARIFDPLARDIEAFLQSSQARVTGDVHVQLHQGQCLVLGATSPCSLLDGQGATYGEESASWTCPLYTYPNPRDRTRPRMPPAL